MKIIILGAGYVGMELASYLANAGHAVTIVDTPSEKLEQIASRIDLRVIAGNPSSPVVLRSAGAENTELMVAATADDEVNITACSIGAFFFHIPRRIARIRSADYLQEADDLFCKGGIPIDHVISPEHIATDDILHLINLPGTSAVAEFFDGMLTLVQVKCRLKGKLIGHIYSEFEDYDGKAVLLAVFRDDKPLDGFRNEFISPDDEVFFCCQTERTLSQLSALRPLHLGGSTITIAGGTHIADALAVKLSERFRVKLIEPDGARALRISDRLYGSEVEIYNADPTSLTFMNEEQLQRSGLFIAASASDESNLMASMLVHRLYKVRTMAIIRGEGYTHLAEDSEDEIDTVISPNESTVSALLSNIRQEGVCNMRLFRHGKSEALELIIEGSHFSSRVIGRSPSELNLPKGVSLGLVLREGHLVKPEENFKFAEGDHALFFVIDHRQVRSLIRYFRPRAFWIPKW